MGMFGAKTGGGLGVSTKQALLGGVFDWLSQQGGGKATVIPTLLARQQAQTESEAAIQKAVELQKTKSLYPDPTGTMQNAAAGGLVPGTPAYQKWVLENGGRPPIWLGNPESGYINPQMGASPTAPAPQSDGPPSDAVNQLRANPGSAAQFDEIFGVGAAQRALGGR